MVRDGICAPRVAYPDLHLMRAPWTRALGLIGRHGIDPRCAYLFDRCPSVHTCFMRVPIDVIACDRDMRVLRVVTMHPWRLASKRIPGTRAIIEAAAGSAEELGIKPGCVLSVVFCNSHPSITSRPH